MSAIGDLLQQAVREHQAGRLDAAERLYNQVLRGDPRNHNALNLLGLIAQTRGKQAEAIALFDRALAAKPAFADAAFNRANVLLAQQEHAQAEASFRQALTLNPMHADARLNLGSLLHSLGRMDDAAQVFRDAVRAAPGDARAHYNLGRCLRDLQDLAGAEAAFKAAVGLEPSNLPQRLGLSDVCLAMGRTTEARHMLEQTLAMYPNAAEVLSALGTVHNDANDLDAALLFYDRALAADPGYVAATVNRGLAHLKMGNLDEGWAAYARRFETGERMFRPRSGGAPWPQWRGELLTGKTIFVWGDQAVGDQILYAGMISEVAAQAGKCLIECEPRLVALFERSFPRATVFAATDKRDLREERIDFQSSSLDLGQWLRRDFENFPKRRGYLIPDVAQVEQFHEKYAPLRAGGNKLVGISWRSKSAATGAQKTVSLEQWYRLLRVPGVTFVNVQYGDSTDDLSAASAAGIDLYHDDSVDSLKDIDRFAAQLTALDLVISVSNTTVHVAGSVGVPTWVLVPEGRGNLWYWFTGREDSPWYSYLRLMRQRADIDVVADIARQLEQLIRKAAPE